MFTAMIKELVFGFEIDGYTWWEMDHECAILVVTPQQPLSSVTTYDCKEHNLPKMNCPFLLTK